VSSSFPSYVAHRTQSTPNHTRPEPPQRRCPVPHVVHDELGGCRLRLRLVLRFGSDDLVGGLVEQTADHLHPAQSVGYNVVDGDDDPDPPAGQPRDHLHLPERAAAIERDGRPACGPCQELVLVREGALGAY
jgi:hypothetical protein